MKILKFKAIQNNWIIIVVLLIANSSNVLSQSVNSLDTIGNVGLGTTQPTEKLEVVGNTKISGALIVDSASVFSSDTYMERTTIDDDLSIFGNLSLNQYYDPDASQFRPLLINGDGLVLTLEDLCRDAGSGIPFWKYDVDKIYFDCPGQGRLGVGTADPIAKIDISGDAHINSNLMINTDVSNSILDVRTNDGSNGIALRAFNNTGISPVQTNSINIVPRLSNWGFSALSREGDLGIIWSDNIVNSTNSTAGFVIAPHSAVDDGLFKGLRISAAGNIGIGTANPTKRLEVGIGGIKISGIAGSGTQYRFEITNTNNTDHFLFFSNTDGDQVKITANGKIYSRAVEVQLGSFPDFVFNKDYYLMPLDELEKYIQANNHLPNVPSQAEVIENGIDLGKMNAVLLQKIEELTLHLIEQQKEIDELKRIIQGNY